MITMLYSTLYTDKYVFKNSKRLTDSSRNDECPTSNPEVQGPMDLLDIMHHTVYEFTILCHFK